jgi:hypothetical protein
MSTFPRSPQIVRGGIALLDPDTGVVTRLISFQYNPETLTRTLQMQGPQGEGDRFETFRFKGPPVETIKLEAEIDASDQLEFPAQNKNAVSNGIQPQLTALEMILYPASGQLQQASQLAAAGTMEIFPATGPLPLFIWSRNRVVPVRITEFSITEESFDSALNPTRAKVSLGMRVLTISDVDFSSKAGSLAMIHHQRKEQLSNLLPSATLARFGLQNLP